jgi:AAA15 family ATPase/GTPase
MFRIQKINLRENKTIKTETCERINLIVGSNNSGKTTFLNDIFSELKILHASPPDTKWTDGMKLTMENAGETVSRVFPGLFERDKFFNFDEISGSLFILKDKNRNDMVPWNEDVFNLLKETKTKDFDFEIGHPPNQDQKLKSLFSFLVRTMVGYEECMDRLGLDFRTEINDICREPENDFIFYLYKNPKVFQQIKQNVKDIYGLTIEFDNIPQGHKPIRNVYHKINKRLNNHYALSREWNAKSKPLNQVGHGIRAYLKLVFALIHPTHQIIFIDEPETFIHPPQRRALGQFIAKLADQQNKQLFVATHDSEFIRGVLFGSSSRKVKVIRLFQENRQYFSTAIDNLEISNLQSSKSSNILNERIINSLFYDKTVLCESENDRIIYEEASAKYHWSKFHNTNFIGFNGHHDTIKFFNKLKGLKIKLAVILDIDYLRTGTFPETIDDIELEKRFKTIKDKLITLFPKNSDDYRDFKALGLKVFQRKKFQSETSNIKELIKQFKSYGVYVAPAGEVEAWTGSKELNAALDKIRTKNIKPLSDFLKEIVVS